VQGWFVLHPEGHGEADLCRRRSALATEPRVGARPDGGRAGYPGRLGYWQQSAEVDGRLAEVSQLFPSRRDSFFERADRYHWEPAPDSGAARAAADLPSPDPEGDPRRGETGHRLIAEVVQTFVLTASGHMGSLASLYASGEVLFSPPTLIRAVIENCAHALWALAIPRRSPPSSDSLAPT
jgi:hypothetical protein